MKKAIFYKEWIKARGCFFLSLAVSLAFTLYGLLQLQRVIGFKGVSHLWEILLSRDTVFIEWLSYLPAAVGLLMALAQFVPEMQHKRLKLTLHLPYPRERMVLLMLCSGLTLLGIVFAADYLALYLYLQSILPAELVGRILMTSLPWYLCGVVTYLLTAWVCLEPTWRRRIVNVLISAGAIRLFFLSSVPQAYDRFLPWLLLLALGSLLLPQLSVSRFKQGRQD